MTQANYAVVGEPYIWGMESPPNADPAYGYAVLDNELTRHFVFASNPFPSTIDGYNLDSRLGIPYVTNGNHDLYKGQGISSPRGFLGYDGSLHLESDPVNQWHVGQPWMIACGTFASHIAEFRDHYHMLREPGSYNQGNSVAHTDESNLRNKVTLWWGRALNGEACRQLAHWMPPGTIVDDLTIGLNPVITDQTPADQNWKIGEATIKTLMDVICDNCLGFNILRRFHRRNRPIDWHTSLNSGIITAPDFDQEEWAPRAIIRNFSYNSTPSRRVEIYNELMEWNGRALDWYDENVTPDQTHQ